MKKAGIITFHFADNYGAVLQAYALANTIEKLGVKAEIIDFVPNKLREPYKLFPNIKNMVDNKGLSYTIRNTLSRLFYIRHNITRIRSFDEFRNTYLNLSERRYNNVIELLNESFDYDYFITGSDQVWNPKFFSHVNGVYFLDFADKKAKKISYAASIAEKVDKSFNKDYSSYLAMFDYISVREESAKEFLCDKTDKKIEVTLDPTLLLNKEEWNRVSTKKNYNFKYILVYDLISDPLIVKIASKLANATGYKVLSYSRRIDYVNWYSSFSSHSPTDFLGLFANAEYIVTNSFHGTAFSIIYNKPFYTVPHKTRGSRMIDLLNSLEINDRLIKKDEDIKDISNSIDYDKVESKLLEQKDRSMVFLKKALGVKKKV